MLGPGQMPHGSYTDNCCCFPCNVNAGFISRRIWSSEPHVPVLTSFSNRRREHCDGRLQKFNNRRVIRQRRRTYDLVSIISKAVTQKNQTSSLTYEIVTKHTPSAIKFNFKFSAFALFLDSVKRLHLHL